MMIQTQRKSSKNYTVSNIIDKARLMNNKIILACEIDKAEKLEILSTFKDLMPIGGMFMYETPNQASHPNLILTDGKLGQTKSKPTDLMTDREWISASKFKNLLGYKLAELCGIKL